MTAPAREGADLPPTTFGYPDPDEGPWQVTLAWRVIDGVPECVGLSIALRPGTTEPLNEALVRRVGLSKRIASERARLLGAGVPGQLPAGMRRSTYERLQAVAETYRQAAAAGERPVRAVQERFDTTPGYAANLVSRARSAGLLPPTSAGVALGEVGE